MINYIVNHDDVLVDPATGGDVVDTTDATNTVIWQLVEDLLATDCEWRVSVSMLEPRYARLVD